MKSSNERSILTSEIVTEREVPTWGDSSAIISGFCSENHQINVSQTAGVSYDKPAPSASYVHQVLENTGLSGTELLHSGRLQCSHQRSQC